MFVAEFHESVRDIIPDLVERLNHPDWLFRGDAIRLLSSLAEQGMC